MTKNTQVKSRKDGKILSIAVNSTPKERVLKKIASKLSEAEEKGKIVKPIVVFTPNPEIVYEASSNLKYSQILNSANILIPDGIGMSMAYEFLRLKSPKIALLKPFASLFQGLFVGISFVFGKKGKLEIIKGRELFVDILKLSKDGKLKVYLLGGKNDVSQKVKRNIEKIYKNVDIKSANGPEINKKGLPINKSEEDGEGKTIENIKNFSPDVLFVGFGAPKQEFWISRNKNKLNSKVVMAVGGTFDYYSKYSNLVSTKENLRVFEWLLRLIRQPKRVIRIIKATILFPISVFLSKI